MWAEDVVDSIVAALPGGAHAEQAAGSRYELAGPKTLSYREIVEVALRSFGRHRPIVGIPMPVVRATLKLTELMMGPDAFATNDEVALLEVPMASSRGTADVERLGVTPRAMHEVLEAP